MGAGRLALALLIGLSTTHPVAAAAQCSVPFGLRPAAPRLPRADEVAPDVPVTYYILALSWAPAWCRTGAARRASERGSNAECAGPARGFLLHGFWPNGDGRRHPQYCAPAGPIDIATLRMAYCMTPSASLLQHEWAAHGTCGWSRPGDYFAREASIWTRLALPATPTLAGRSLPAGSLRALFAQANPGLPPEAVAVRLDREQRLREVDICYARDFAPMPCGRGEHGAPDDIMVRVSPTLTPY
nr:hypothetical protein [uncultured Lichenicoccus sp.]